MLNLQKKGEVNRTYWNTCEERNQNEEHILDEEGGREAIE